MLGYWAVYWLAVLLFMGYAYAVSYMHIEFIFVKRLFRNDVSIVESV